MTPPTRISYFDGWYAKREDEAAMCGRNYPSGSKMRQYLRMAQLTPGAPMIVGCSADSCMQVYVAAAAKLAACKGIVYTAKRAVRSAATLYALEMGAEVIEVPHGYLSVVRAHTKARCKELGAFVRWQPAMALEDAAGQVGNIPPDAKRIVVATGSGLTAAGVMLGLARESRYVPVVAVCVSQMATYEGILAMTKAGDFMTLPKLTLVPPTMPYSKPVHAQLPDGTVLDPFYAAKALPFIEPGDVFWIPGVRPHSAMPVVKPVRSRKETSNEKVDDSSGVDAGGGGAGSNIPAA